MQQEAGHTRANTSLIMLSQVLYLIVSPRITLKLIVQERVLLDWIVHLGLLAQPVECQTIVPCVRDMHGHYPGKSWLLQSRKRHPAHFAVFLHVESQLPRQINCWIAITMLGYVCILIVM